jgi:hypothetical protein
VYDKKSPSEGEGKEHCTLKRQWAMLNGLSVTSGQRNHGAEKCWRDGGSLKYEIKCDDSTDIASKGQSPRNAKKSARR